MLKGIICIIIAYLLGNINCATLISTKLKKTDIRTVGSGNAGTTNMIRTFGTKLGLITFFGDFLKGVIAVLICMLIGGKDARLVYGCIGAFFVVIGHIWPAVYQFKGGKGAATSLGAIFIVSPFIALFALIAAGLALALTKKMSISSLLGVTIALVLALFISPLPMKLLMVGIFIIIVFKHKDNIQRLLEGKENDTFKRQ